MFTIWLDPENDDPKPASADLKVRDLAELHQLWQAGAERNPSIIRTAPGLTRLGKVQRSKSRIARLRA